MIISASRRTDIPAFYSEWFMNRLKEGYLLVPNPYDPNRLGRIWITPENVDCIVFWTKDPAPMFEKFRQLDSMRYKYYVQFTLTPYDKSIETYLPPKPELLQTFREMSERIGKMCSVWRYDPVIIDTVHTIEWHLDRFEEMCGILQDHTERCFLSFVDPYRSIEKRFRVPAEDEMASAVSGFSEIARRHGIELFSCAERVDLSRYGILPGSCVDRELIEKIIGYRITANKDTNQRDTCRCTESVDIGVYGTCPHGCSYCYAATNRVKRMAAHDPTSPILSGRPKGNETITDRTRPSHRTYQPSLFQYE